MELNWDAFEKLPGSADSNWELLCRELVRRNYSRFGSFRSVLQQPGVEFHLAFAQDCELGDKGRHFGWQCRWYDIRPGSKIGVNRRNKIIQAISKTKEHVTGVSDWVLWTKRSLTPEDQKWFYGLSSPYKLHLWAEDEVKGLLIGDAAILRRTFFGELVLTEQKLKDLQEDAMVPIQKRWDPALHIESEVEQEVRSLLGTPGSWPELRRRAELHISSASTLEAELTLLDDSEKGLAESAIVDLRGQAAHLTEISDALDSESSVQLAYRLQDAHSPKVQSADFLRMASRLRKINSPVSLTVVSARAAMRAYFDVLARIADTLKHQIFAVTGDAGFGKTFLAAELTKSGSGQFGGVLLHAKQLGRSDSLDSILKGVRFGGTTFTELLESVHAYGARIGRRIPIVIDGLNESEEPSNWKELLEALAIQINRDGLSHCVIVVTLRVSVVDDALPAQVKRLELSGFRDNLEQATDRYFEYYKINADGARLPWEQMQSPLFLNLFCQAVNPKRERAVGPISLPSTLAEVFALYRDGVVERAHKSLRKAKHFVSRSISEVGLAIWDGGTRDLEFDTLKTIVGDTPCAWQDSLARFLEEEGVLGRDPAAYWHPGSLDDGKPRIQVSEILYDAFAGFVIAEALLERTGHSSVGDWFSENSKRFQRGSGEKHPLGDDVFKMLAALVPKQQRSPFLEFVPSDLREKATLVAIDSDERDLGDTTVEAVQEMFAAKTGRSCQPLIQALFRVSNSINHPLNADLLWECLSRQGVAQRDLSWTEWMREHRKEIVQLIDKTTERWKNSPSRSNRDELRAKVFAWFLTSTVRYLRDATTRALYWYGSGNPSSIFELTVRGLSLNDPYVSERLLAASYGVLLGHQRTPETIEQVVEVFVRRLADALVGEEATHPTNHWLSRQYVQGIVEFCNHFLPTTVPDRILDKNGVVRFRKAAYVSADDVNGEHPGQIGMDFENYEVGSLFDDRSNYDYSHSGYQKAITEIRGRVWQLGYRYDEFKNADEDIASRFTHRNEPSGVERYAKKYGWIGYYEKAGVLSDEKSIDFLHRGWRFDIDPSFPDPPASRTFSIPNWLGSEVESDETWFTNHQIEVPNELLRLTNIADSEHEWFATEGYLSREDKLRGRRVFAFFRGILVPRNQLDEFVSTVSTKDYLGNYYIPASPNDHATFAGEIPWSRHFANDEDESEDGIYCGSLGGYFEEGIAIERLGHHFAWESHHSSTNQTTGYVPSRDFSTAFELRAGRSEFGQYDRHGLLASLTLGPPPGFEDNGSVLYLRGDLLSEYASKRDMAFVVVAWGEKLLTNMGEARPGWMQKGYDQHEYVWRVIKTEEQLKTESNDIA